MIDLPPLGTVADTAPQVVIAANGASGGWRNAPLLASADGGVSFQSIGSTAFPATIGIAQTALPAGSVALVDRVNHVDVALVHAGLVLSDADETALLAGANFAMLGSEAIQFGSALPLGGARYRLSKLWRGRRGTEAGIERHVAGEAFVLIESETLRLVPAELAIDGLKVMAAGIGDGSGVLASVAKTGASITPLSPAHVVATFGPDGGVTVKWKRRSREGWNWNDGIDAPLAEEGERYRLTRIATGRVDVVADLTGSAWVYPPTLLAADRVAGLAEVMVAVVQVGSRGVSAPTYLTIPLI